MYCISMVSMDAFSTLSSDRNRCSIWFPVLRLRSLHWTMPRQFPGVMWVTVMTRCSCPL